MADAKGFESGLEVRYSNPSLPQVHRMSSHRSVPQQHQAASPVDHHQYGGSPIDYHQHSASPVDYHQPSALPADYYQPQYTSAPSQGVAHGAPRYADSIPESSKPKQQHRVCGMSVILYSILLAALTAIIVGAAVGGGVGSQLGSCDAEIAGTGDAAGLDAGATTTVTKTMTPTGTASSAISTSTDGADTDADGRLVGYHVIEPRQISTLPQACPDANGTRITTKYSYDFDVVCDDDLFGADLGSFWAYSFEDCVGACSAMNYYQQDSRCQAVIWLRYMGQVVDDDNYGNCWLKKEGYEVRKGNGVSARLN